MESIYNDYVRDRFLAHETPVKGLKAHIIEYNEDEYLALRLYRSNFEQFDDAAKKRIVLWCNEVLEDLNKIIPISLEIWK